MKKTPCLRSNLGLRLLTSASVLACALASTSINTASAAEAGSGDFAVDELIVTANKREQSVQDVSLAISAYSAEAIADRGLTDITQIAQYSPNVDVKYAWGNSMPIYTIRGVGMNSFQASDTPSVGLFIDEVFQTSLVTMGPQLFDAERIEVLRGPQGALFGRNTNGGAVSYFSKRPSQEFDALARLDYGSFKRLELEAAVGGPLTENLSGRLSMLTVQQGEGLYKNRTTGATVGEVDTLAARGQLLFKPSDDLSVLFKAFASRDRSQPVYFQHVGFWNRGATASTPAASRFCPAFQNGQLNAGVGGTDPSACFDVLGYSDRDGDPYAGEYTNRPDTPINDHAKLKNDIWGLTLTVNKEFSFGSLTSISAYQHADRVQPKESDANPKLFLDLVFGSAIESWSQDIRLMSNDDGRLRWIVGGSIAGDKVSESPARIIYADDYLGFRPRVEYTQDRKAYSIFAQGDFALTDQLNLSAGIRGIREDISFESQVSFLFPPNFTQPGTVVSTCPSPALKLDCKLETKDYAGRLAIEYKPTSDVMLYASYSRGFKGGGFNGGLVTNATLYRPFDPEIVLAKEIGLKAQVFDGRMIFNAAAFTYEYQGLQAATPRPDPVTGTPLNFLANLADASIKGAEVEIRLRPIEHLDASLGVGWLDTKNNDPGVNFNGFVGRSPRVLPNSPEFSVNASVSYDISINDKYDLRLHTDYSWEDEQYKEIVNSLLVPAQSVWNARITLSDTSGAWKFSAYAKNLLDDVNVVDTLTDPGVSGWGVIVYGQPRTLGVSISRHW